MSVLASCALDSYSVNKPHLAEQQPQVMYVCLWAWRELVRHRTRAGHHFSHPVLWHQEDLSACPQLVLA